MWAECELTFMWVLLVKNGANQIEFVEGEDIDEKVLGEGRRKVEDFAEGKRGGTIVDVAESALIAVVVVVKGKSEHIEAGLLVIWERIPWY